MSKVFMCHATPDKPEVEWVASTLRDLRPELEFWLDTWSMVPGDSVIAKINQGLSSSDRLVVFLTPDSVQSPWVERELDAGLVLEVAKQRGFEGDNFVIPVVLKPLPSNYSFPALLAPRLRCDFTTATSFDAACADLLRGILGTPSGPSTTRMQNLAVRWERFSTSDVPSQFGMRLTFEARLTPEQAGYEINVGQPYASVRFYFGSPRLGGAYTGVWESGERDKPRGIYHIYIDKPRIAPERPFVVEFTSADPWAAPPSYGRWAP